ncbi:MAG: ribonuclease P protein component [Mycoplasmataceae bacterium]|jgi:ribonuclease P protein component|nr:ribonuclease P protein component [Mycoplasmataceae bacterium]
MKNNFISVSDRHLITKLKKDVHVLWSKVFKISYIESPKTKYLIIISKKNFKLAVTRNLIRRQIRTMLKTIKLDVKMAISIIVNKQFAKETYASNLLDLTRLLQKIH